MSFLLDEFGANLYVGDMRVIKFRIWDSVNCFWVGEVLDSTSNHVNQWFTKKNLVFQQFTGLKDKNNKEIYEGDWCFADGQRVIIVFKDGAFGYDRPFLGMHCILIPELMEVIGNKFEHAELIKIWETKEFYGSK